MAPRPTAHRRGPASQGQQLFELGQQGRKTGIVLEDTGIRDEYGMEPVDGLFSSPEKERHISADSDEEEQDMELDEASSPGPATVRAMLNRTRDRNGRVSLPRSRSPIKTNLRSPARQIPHLPPSSPTRGSIYRGEVVSPPKQVNRRLDFSMDPRPRMHPLSNGHPRVNASHPQDGKLTNGHAQSNSEDEDEDEEEEQLEQLDVDVEAAEPEEEEEEEEEEEAEAEAADQEQDDDDDSMQGVNMGVDDDVDMPQLDGIDDEEDGEDYSNQEESEVEEEPIPKVVPAKTQAKARPGRPPKAAMRPSPVIEESVEPTEVAEEPVKKKRGRPKMNHQHDDVEASEARQAKRQRTTTVTGKGTATKGKPGRPRKTSDIGVDSPSIVIQKGPPLPKGRGLYIARREQLSDGAITTRSGRHSYKPVQYWKGERAEYDEEHEDVFADGHVNFKLPSLKAIVRVEEDEASKPKRRAGRPAGRPAKRRSLEDDDDELEDWERHEGRVQGECIYWNPEYELSPPADEDEVEVATEEIAVSAKEAENQLRDIKDATFRFAKTLSLPFFGVGVVDLPPGSEKRPKNSRKMHMAFFVHYGRVQVSVASTTFRIGKGGMWFVPRGNHYSIENDTDRPARIFFSQGCEITVDPDTE